MLKFSPRVFFLVASAISLGAGAQAAPPQQMTLTKGTGELSSAEVQVRRPVLNTNTATLVPEMPAPVSPREHFNAGTKQLRNGKLKEAEASLESVLASQKPALQPVALYNLGHVRFKQGIEQLMKGPPAKPTSARARNAGAEVKEALKDVDQALASDDVPKMVAAYMRGRGARKEAREAIKVVERALEAHGGTLTKWHRSEGDFRSTVELKRNDEDAQHNADVLDRCIAKLVDSIRELQQAAMAAGDKGQELKDKLGKLKGKIPAPNMPPGGGGEDEEDEDNPNGPKPGDKEAPSKDGKELAMSPEQAGWLLDALRPGGDRRLPMGQDGKAEPKNPNKPTW
jgi:hypothetical protein